jgi:V/A-type H+-transporting ATPase subunit A
MASNAHAIAQSTTGQVVSVSGPLVVARLPSAVMGGQVEVGAEHLVGEVIRVNGDLATLQMYEWTELLRPGDPARSFGNLLSVELGPGLLGRVFDGIQRPLELLRQREGVRIHRGATLPALARERSWAFVPKLKVASRVHGGAVLGTVQETLSLEHRVLVPPAVDGELIELAAAGEYQVGHVVARVRNGERIHELSLFHRWPVRRSRPAGERFMPHVPLLTGQRVLDTLFPVAKGGTAAVPGPFGAGKTIVQHQLARWCDANIIIFVGCGERGNEMLDVLEQFARLLDPRSNRPLLERSILLANTSNMPVTAREASIYTGITIAEYFRDQGYHVALMADSTSRWAEALREVAGRLEELPAEEGYPAYLGSRLAMFYERAGHVRTLNGQEGSVTLIGSVSPPGGDLSEPVTRHTQGIVRSFWVLSKTLADARHYPAIDWDLSFSDYADKIAVWWDQQPGMQNGRAELRLENKDVSAGRNSPILRPTTFGSERGWAALRRSMLELLREADEIKQIASVIGPAALSDRQQWTFFAANLVKEAFLQQNALDPVDSFCTPAKQLALFRLLLNVYEQGRASVASGLSCKPLLRLPSLQRLKRARSEIPNDRLDLVEQLHDNLQRELAEAATR